MSYNSGVIVLVIFKSAERVELGRFEITRTISPWIVLDSVLLPLQMAIAVTLRGFNDLGRSVTPIFHSKGHFLYRFSTFCEKMKKIYRKTLHSVQLIPSNILNIWHEKCFLLIWKAFWNTKEWLFSFWNFVSEVLTFFYYAN